MDRKALKWTEQNHIHAIYMLGESYESGQVLERNIIEAIKWYRLASDNGRVDATYKLGLCYEEGRGVEKDIEEAKLKLGLAFDTSSIPSNLSNHELMRRGDDYFYGRRGLPQDYLEAIKYYYKAAENSDVVAENDLGNCFAQGKGCPVSHTEAVYWYQQAVKHGYMSTARA